MTVLNKTQLLHPDDVLTLNLIDFTRLNGYWDNLLQAAETIFSWWDGAIVTTIKHENYHDAPEREDWPGWEHTGDHPFQGRQYWNWFWHDRPNGCKLVFSDSPDFWGHLDDGSGFWGDIGMPSASAVALTQKSMGAHELFIFVHGPVHYVLETQWSPREAWGSSLGNGGSQFHCYHPQVESRYYNLGRLRVTD